MVRIPQSMVKCGQWTIGNPDDTAQGVAWLHSLDTAHVTAYRDYAQAYIRAVRRRGLAPKVKTKAFMQKLHYYFYAD